jgi:hypothetical protein
VWPRQSGIEAVGGTVEKTAQLARDVAFALDGECRDGRHAMPARVSYEDTDFSGTSELRVVPQYGKIDS